MFGSCFRTLAVIIASVFVLLFCYLVSAEGSYSKDCGGGDVSVCVCVGVCVCLRVCVSLCTARLQGLIWHAHFVTRVSPLVCRGDKLCCSKLYKIMAVARFYRG